MGLPQLTGQSLARTMLQNAVAGGHVSHAYIFHGPAGTGKRRAALAFAKTLLCEAGGTAPCGECLSCRKVDSGNHTGLTVIGPEGASVKIEQIRGLKRQYVYRSEAGVTRQVYIVEHADRMTAQAGNSLLKFLEEPAVPLTAILLATNLQALLPTIRSRAQAVPFMPLPPDEMERQLTAEGIARELARPAVRLAAGLEAARELAEANWFAEIRSLVIQLAQESARGGQQALVTAMKRLPAHSELAGHLDVLFDLFLLWFKDMLHIQGNRREKVVFIDQIETLSGESYKRTAARWTALMKEALEAKRRLRSHANAQLVLDHFLLALERR